MFETAGFLVISLIHLPGSMRIRILQPGRLLDWHHLQFVGWTEL